MAQYLTRMAFWIVVIAFCSSQGLQREQPEEDEQGRGRLHQLCKSILNGDDPLETDGLPKHDRIRHHRHKSKCKYHARAEERCRKKYLPDNGTVRSFHDNFYGWVVEVRCDKGFSLQGRSTIICYEELDKKERPFCKIKDCGDPVVKRNTTFIYASTTYSSQLHVDCDKGFNHTRSPKSKCMASGKWSPIARCVKKACPAIKSPAFGRYHETTPNNHGRVHSFMFECAPGYQLVGSNNTVCHYGVWSSPEPRCMYRPDERTENRSLTVGLVSCMTLFIALSIMAVLYKYYSYRRNRTLFGHATCVPTKSFSKEDTEETRPAHEICVLTKSFRDEDTEETRPAHATYVPTKSFNEEDAEETVETIIDMIDMMPLSLTKRNHYLHSPSLNSNACKSFQFNGTNLHISSLHNETFKKTFASLSQGNELEKRCSSSKDESPGPTEKDEDITDDAVPSTSDIGLANTSNHMLCREHPFPVLKSKLPICLVTPLKTGDDDTRGLGLGFANHFNDDIERGQGIADTLTLGEFSTNELVDYNERGQDRTDTLSFLGFPNQLNDGVSQVQDGTEATIQRGFPNQTNNGITQVHDGMEITIQRGFPNQPNNDVSQEQNGRERTIQLVQGGTKMGQDETDLSTKEDIPAEALRLNWNKLFFYLVPKVCTDNWKLFAINLLGSQLPHGQSACTTLCQIENRSKTQAGGEKIECILFNVLWHWKNLTKTAQLTDIETALKWSSHQDVIHDLKNDVGKFYEQVAEPEHSLTLKNKSLNGIPELEYRALTRESTIMAYPLFEEPAERVGSLPVSPCTEELMTYNYGFNEMSGFHFQQGKRFYKTKRQYSYPPFNRLRYKYKFPERAKVPPRRPTKSKPKVENSNRSKTVPLDVSIQFTETDTMCADLLNRILDLDSSKKLNSLEFRMLTKYVLYKVHNSTSANTELHDLLEITFDDFTMCDHVSTPRNGTLHILNSCEIRLFLMDAEWELLERYVLRARNDAIERAPEIEHRYLFLTYDGHQVTTEYLSANNGGTSDTNVVKEQSQLTEDLTVPMATDSNRGRPNAAHAHKTGAKFDFKLKVPVSRRSNFDRCAEKRQTDSNRPLQHGRRFFCEKQTTTIEAVFKDEILQGFVKESAILNRFLNSAVLREAFGVNPNEVTKILVKKVADRVRCFIRKRKA